MKTIGLVPRSGTLSPLAYIEHEHEAVQQLGLSPEDAEKIGVGFAGRGMMKGRVVWPLYAGDKLVGYLGTLPDGDVKLPKTLRF